MPEELKHDDSCEGCPTCCEVYGHMFEGDVECQNCHVSYVEIHGDNYDEGER